MTTSQAAGPAQAFAKVAVGVDFSGSSDGALLEARRRFPAAERLLIHVVDARASTIPDISGAGMVPVAPSADLMNTLTETDTKHLRELTQPGESHEVLSGDPASALVEAAGKWGAELLVVGTHTQGALEHFFVGSVAEQVIRKARLPVLVIKTDRHQ